MADGIPSAIICIGTVILDIFPIVLYEKRITMQEL